MADEAEVRRYFERYRGQNLKGKYQWIFDSEREEESMLRVLAGIIGRVLKLFWEPQTTEKEQEKRFCFEPSESTNAQPSDNVLDICLFTYEMRMTSCASTYLRGLLCRTNKIKHTSALKRTHNPSTTIIIKMQALTLSFSCCQMQKTHSNFIFETVLQSL